VTSVTESDPGALMRVLGLFQIRNLVPTRVCAVTEQNGWQTVTVEIAGVNEREIELICAKISQLTCVLCSEWKIRGSPE
jgi:acetolactate synthase small subunit